jgi:hypothetical protein
LKRAGQEERSFVAALLKMTAKQRRTQRLKGRPPTKATRFIAPKASDGEPFFGPTLDIEGSGTRKDKSRSFVAALLRMTQRKAKAAATGEKTDP